MATKRARTSSTPELPAPISQEVTMPLLGTQNPDGSKPVEPAVLEGLPPELVSTYDLGVRLFTQHGRLWLAGRLLGPEAIETILRTLGERHDLGLHLSCVGKYPGLGGWLRWEGLAGVKHLSWNGAFLGAKGLELLLATGKLGAVETLDLSVCDVGLKGLRLLNASDAMPRLSELYLGANPDFDRTRYDEKAVAALLAEKPSQPIGASLRGLRVLSLLFWELVKAIPVLEASSVIQGLRELWIWDKLYAKSGDCSNVKALPRSLRPKCVVDWERRRLS